MSSATSPDGQLDADELMHLALGAMGRNRYDEALLCLQRALLLAPDSGLLHQLLGMLHAELGRIDLATRELTLAITFVPALKMARFQLGVLHFRSGDIAAADTVWAPLGDLDEGDSLRLFRSGLLSLAGHEYAASIADLRRGVETNTEYPSLNPEIEEMIVRAERATADRATGRAPRPAETPGKPAGDSAQPVQHVLLSGYFKS